MNRITKRIIELSSYNWITIVLIGIVEGEGLLIIVIGRYGLGGGDISYISLQWPSIGVKLIIVWINVL